MLKHICAYGLMLGALGTLFFLGNWQLERLAWKTDIIDALQNAYENPTDLTWQDLNQDGFIYGKLTGTLQADQIIFLGPKTNTNSEIGYHAIVPIQTKRGMLLGNFGWVETQEMSVPKARQVTVTGLVRKPEWNRFTPNNSPENNVWTKPNIAEISEFLGLENVASTMIYIEETQPELKEFEPHPKGWFPRNKHAQYASFWFFMAFVMVIIIGGYSVRLIRRNT